MNFDILQEVMYEFSGDLKKQFIVMMGLPAAGKSTFLQDELPSHFPHVNSISTTSSDNMVVRFQYRTAKEHFDYLEDNVDSEEEFSKFVDDTTYKSNSGKKISLPFSYEEWKSKWSNKSFTQYFKAMYKPYYATYFDIRSAAKEVEKEVFDDKLHTGSNFLVYDTTATNTKKVLRRMKATKDKGFITNVIFLDIDPELSIERDKWRGEHEGRSVGKDLISNYVPKLKRAYKVYTNIAKNEDIVDRIMKFDWHQRGDSPIDGEWKLERDEKYHVTRKLDKDG